MADFCDKCGAMLAEGIKYCTSCGEKVEDAVEETVDNAGTEPTVAGTDNVASSNNDIVSEPTTNIKDDSVSEISEEVNEQSSLEHIKEADTEVISPEPVYSSSDYTTNNSNYSGNSSKATYAETPVKNNPGFAIASMICGILSLLCCCFAYLGLVLAIAAIVLGIIALVKKYDGKGMAIAGIVCGGIGLVIVLIFMVIGLAFSNAMSSDEIIKQLENGNFDFEQFL